MHIVRQQRRSAQADAIHYHAEALRRAPKSTYTRSPLKLVPGSHSFRRAADRVHRPPQRRLSGSHRNGQHSDALALALPAHAMFLAATATPWLSVRERTTMAN